MDNITVLKREFDELKVVAEKQELRVRYHETRANRIAMAYFISWERFLAFGMYQYNTSSLNCSHWWMLLGFNLAGSFLYILFFVEAVIMLYRAHNDLDIISQTLDEISQHIIILNQVTNQDGGHRLESGDSVSASGFGFSFRLLELECRPYRILPRKLYFASILCAFLAIIALQIYMTFNYYSPCN